MDRFITIMMAVAISVIVHSGIKIVDVYLYNRQFDVDVIRAQYEKDLNAGVGKKNYYKDYTLHHDGLNYDEWR
jgi:hypothetical protein